MQKLFWNSKLANLCIEFENNLCRSSKIWQNQSLFFGLIGWLDMLIWRRTTCTSWTGATLRLKFFARIWEVFKGVSSENFFLFFFLFYNIVKCLAMVSIDAQIKSLVFLDFKSKSLMAIPKGFSASKCDVNWIFSKSW